MDKPTDKGDQKQKSADELDLIGLRDFNFASNWSEAPAAPARREGGGHGRADGKRDRRPDRRPGGARNFRSGVSERDAGGGARGGKPQRRPRPEQREERPGALLLRQSPYEVQIFPDDPILGTLTKAMRQSLRTYELFEVARLILEKPERFHVSFRFKQEGASPQPLFQSMPDSLPFTTEEAALDHVFRNHLGTFFEVEEVETDPPKGSFQFIARCTLTGDFLSPPNYHRYQAILLQYHQERFPDMPIERFRSSIETVKDEEAVQQWLEGMKKQKRYKAAGSEETVFDTPEDARAHLLQHKKNELVRSVKAVRLAGTQVGQVTDPEIRPYLEAYIDYQRRFPLDTANSLRGRLRRQHFFIYKKGSRGISYVCAVKRKQRQSGQVFSETIGALIEFLENNDQIPAKDLPEKMLGVTIPPADSETKPEPEVQEKLKRLNLDLRWLVSEGYVTEFSDGRLVVHPVAESPPAAKAEGAPSTAAAAPAAEGETAQQAEKSAETDSPEASGETLPKAATEAETEQESGEPGPAEAPAGETPPSEPAAESESAQKPEVSDETETAEPLPEEQSPLSEARRESGDSEE